MKKYDYQWLQQKRDPEDDMKSLKDLGLGGWQVCAFMPRDCHPTMTLFFLPFAYLLSRELEKP